MRRRQLEPSQNSTAGMPAKLNLSGGKDWDDAMFPTTSVFISEQYPRQYLRPCRRCIGGMRTRLYFSFKNFKSVISTIHCQKLGTRWRLRVRTKATMAAKSYKKMYGDKETFSKISIMSLRVFGARLETC